MDAGSTAAIIRKTSILVELVEPLNTQVDVLMNWGIEYIGQFIAVSGPLINIQILDKDL